jgi:hypothetical protein
MVDRDIIEEWISKATEAAYKAAQNIRNFIKKNI